MPAIHIEDKIYSKISAEQIKGNNLTYENCKFTGCDFAGNYLDSIVFIDCVFEDCNLALASVANTGFQNINFTHCKLSGVNFSKSRDFLFEINFDHCILDNAIFYRKKNKSAKFSDCSMVETDLTEADLASAKFVNCNLHRAFFNNTILKGADLRTSFNFNIDPDINHIKKACFSLNGLPGLLSKYDIKVE
ncbi:pentapeptide repeat-containing protein [Mucilaginibacter segetis]|uniref:Pentapeptide repeat-containing protein n=1 Tax=Mucilaginibacter segetis TaxID=2793071 RepID=A0A934ULQ5_9SPHI|nr:pentapeptide repeat-containing protein [Mucilaginibacter segetis]MBK0378082.1 pentapeptide repeat-containing protein [Mucilaginibacter segetis]